MTGRTKQVIDTPRQTQNLLFLSPHAKNIFVHVSRVDGQLLPLREEKPVLDRGTTQHGGCGKPRTHLRALVLGWVATPAQALPRAWDGVEDLKRSTEMTKRRKPSKADLKAAMMPPLRHNVAKPFDITESEVAQWLVEQPEVMQQAFDIANSHGVIVYDPKTGLWRGVDWR